MFGEEYTVQAILLAMLLCGVKSGFIGHFFEIATLNSDITGCRRIG